MDVSWDFVLYLRRVVGRSNGFVSRLTAVAITVISTCKTFLLIWGKHLIDLTVYFVITHRL